MTELVLAERRCSGCLTTRNRIVTGERAAAIVRDCVQQANHFFCHKGDGHTIHCAGVHAVVQRKRGGTTAYRFATAMGIPVRLVNPDSEEFE